MISKSGLEVLDIILGSMIGYSAVVIPLIFILL
jgi:hypothetical protein